MKNTEFASIMKSQVERLLLEEGTAAGIILTDGQRSQGRSGYCGNGRSFLSHNRFYRRRISFCPGGGAYCDRFSPLSGSSSYKRRVYSGNGRSFPEKCGADREKRKKSPLQGFWGDDVYSFRNYGTSGSFCQRQTGHGPQKIRRASAFLDLKPALTPEQLDARILREFESGKNKQFKNVIIVLFPSSLTPVMLKDRRDFSGKTHS